MLVLRGVSVSKTGRRILTEVDLGVVRGQLILLSGPNGSGKTTLLRTVAGLERPERGVVCLREENIVGMAPSRIAAAGVSYLQQGSPVFPNLSVRENLVVSDIGQGLTITEVLDRFPLLGAIVNKRAGLLSAGQRQLLALAMILIKGGSVYLLDEPVSAMATTLAERALEFFAQSAKLLAATILVEHRSPWILGLADLHYHIVDGSLKQDISDDDSVGTELGKRAAAKGKTNGVADLVNSSLTRGLAR